MGPGGRGALKFLLGNGLTPDDARPERSRRVFDWQDLVILPLPRLPPAMLRVRSPQSGAESEWLIPFVIEIALLPKH